MDRKVMSWLLMLLLVLSGLGVVSAERRAAACGDGLVLEPDLPHGLKAEWFNGGFWITDQEGWGVVGLPDAIEMHDGTTIDVQRVVSYRTLGDQLEMRVQVSSGGLLTIAASQRSNGKIELAQPDLAAADAENPAWVPVTATDCNPMKLMRNGLGATFGALLTYLLWHVLRGGRT